ncbi:hypothetical protein N0V86_004694 [Didymella sp. IMI 355093]|nr:hypothetical protein N0V86_004694 [Didymella sp. IMI 355093]
MNKQQEGPRRKLRPRKPTKRGISKKRSAPPPNYGKQEGLTANQHAWARSFTVSLSGWRNRQKFYKDHLKAGIQAEFEAKTTSAAYDAKRLAQREAKDEEEAEQKAREQAEGEEEKAKAWSHKAWEMHKAGRGVRKLKHEYFGWDPEEEEYLRDFETERLKVLLKAKRMEKRRAAAEAAGHGPDEVYDSDNDQHDSDSDDSGGSEIIDRRSASRSASGSRSPSGSPSQSPQRPAPIVERAPVMNWREKARAGVIKKKLSVTKGWGAITWTQKSNVQERLLVLEDDGYDIEDLLDGKAPSDKVTSIILTRAAGEQQSASQVSQLLMQPVQTALSQGDAKADLPPAWLDPALTDQYLGPTEENSSPGSPPRSPSGSPSGSSAPNASSPRSAESPQQQFDNAVEDETQLFSFDEPYYPQPSRRPKRTRDDEVDPDVEDEVMLVAPVYKKRKVDISKCAFDNMMAELHFLANVAEGETTSQIHDPDDDDDGDDGDGDGEDEDLTYTPVKPGERTRQNTRMMQRQASRIAITVDAEDQMTFQGDAMVLAGLLKALRKRALLHHADWAWDGLCLRQTNGLSWYLSPQTHDTFVDIESRLERRSRIGGVEVVVGVVDEARANDL